MYDTINLAGVSTYRAGYWQDEKDALRDLMCDAAKACYRCSRVKRSCYYSVRKSGCRVSSMTPTASSRPWSFFSFSIDVINKRTWSDLLAFRWSSR